MPGATDDFHTRAGMDNTAFGAGMQKNSRVQVARHGFDAMMAGRAQVVGGDAATRRTVIKHRFLPETLKAARHARRAKPRPQISPVKGLPTSDSLRAPVNRAAACSVPDTRTRLTSGRAVLRGLS
jgi:hypothetical protein